MIDPFNEVSALHAQAQSHLKSGEQKAALADCRNALDVFNALAAPPSVRAAYWLFLLGGVFEATSAYADAESCADRAVGVLGSLPSAGPSADLLLLRSLGLFGTALRQQGQYERAREPLKRAIALAEAPPDRPEEVSNAWNNIGIVCKFAGWFEEGEDAYRRALAAAERQERHRDGMVATILHNIGGLHHARGRFDIAEEPARRAWELRRTLAGDDDPAVLADATAYAAILDGLRRFKESRRIYEHALEIYERIFGPEHYEVAATLHNLALVELAEGNRERAIALARRALAIKQKILGIGHPDTALSAMNLGSMLIAVNSDEARSLLESALPVFESRLAPEHPHIARCRQLLDRLR